MKTRKTETHVFVSKIKGELILAQFQFREERQQQVLRHQAVVRIDNRGVKNNIEEKHETNFEHQDGKRRKGEKERGEWRRGEMEPIRSRNRKRKAHKLNFQQGGAQ